MNDRVWRKFLDGFARQLGQRAMHEFSIFRQRLDPPKITRRPDEERHLRVFAREAADDMRAEKPGGSRDQNLHRALSGAKARAL
jgi:hypothetical protein